MDSPPRRRVVASVVRGVLAPLENTARAVSGAFWSSPPSPWPLIGWLGARPRDLHRFSVRSRAPVPNKAAADVLGAGEHVLGKPLWEGCVLSVGEIGEVGVQRSRFLMREWPLKRRHDLLDRHEAGPSRRFLGIVG